ncbi:MAG: hypothetical protein HFACDABA_02749 [Anaerolineales bacterium]|nr:hypothetical protein [Anaerolineales bacterium]
MVRAEKNSALIGQFFYDADGKQVKTIVNGVTTSYVGNHYEVKDGAVTKYYFAGTTRLAVRHGTTLNYLLSDHLGSSSVTTDENGIQTAQAMYKTFGETRYFIGDLKTDYTFTGQREEASLGLYFFVSRWLDPSLGRFTSPDTIVPTSTQGTQAWDRYAFVNNNPVRYTDPTGHWAFDLSAGLNSLISAVGFSPTSVANGLDTAATLLDIGGAAISGAIAAADAVAAVMGFTVGAGASIPGGGTPAVVTGPAGAGLGIAFVEMNPAVRIAATVSDAMGWASTSLTAISDVITGDTNVAGSISSSSDGLQIELNSSIGRDTLTSGVLSYMGTIAPIGLMDFPCDAVGLLDDFGFLYQGPLAGVPESIPLIDEEIEVEY